LPMKNGFVELRLDEMYAVDGGKKVATKRSTVKTARRVGVAAVTIVTCVLCPAAAPFAVAAAVGAGLAGWL
jgi:hypothetical protein